MSKSHLQFICLLSIFSLASCLCLHPLAMLLPNSGNYLIPIATAATILLISPIWANARWKLHLIKVHCIPLDRGYFNYKSKGRPSITPPTHAEKSQKSK
ncbi:MAG: hypothetical protein FJ010_12690 [Chloroflexi bacterium]|nr:hypothetical protein [Chloroflexota bacterium]